MSGLFCDNLKSIDIWKGKDMKHLGFSFIMILAVFASIYAQESFELRGVPLGLDAEFYSLIEPYYTKTAQNTDSTGNIEDLYGVQYYEAVDYKGDVYIKTIMSANDNLNSPEFIRYWGLDLSILRQQKNKDTQKPYFSISEAQFERVQKAALENSKSTCWVKEIREKSLLCQQSDKETEYAIKNLNGAVMESLWIASEIPVMLINIKNTNIVSGAMGTYYDLMFVDMENPSTIEKSGDAKLENSTEHMAFSDIGEKKSSNLEIIFLYVSSQLTEPFDKNNYHPVKVFDGDPKTCWLEKVSGPGRGEFLEVEFNKEITIDAIEFLPGVFWPGYWKRNNRIRRLEIEADDENFQVGFKDLEMAQRVTLKKPLTFKKIRFTIQDIYKTTDWDDSGISEIDFYFKNKKIQFDFGLYEKFFKKVPQ